jgi:hypothetical protein
LAGDPRRSKTSRGNRSYRTIATSLGRVALHDFNIRNSHAPTIIIIILYKTKIIKLERTQRSLLKAMFKKPYLYPTQTLYEEARVMTVRQLFILQVTLRQHKHLPYTPLTSQPSTRRPLKICQPINHNTAFFRRHPIFLRVHLYNKLNLALNIYPKLTHKCKTIIKNYLMELNYNETELLIK